MLLNSYACMSLLAQGALADYNAAVVIDPTNKKALQTRGMFQLQLGRLQVILCVGIACCGSLPVLRPCKLGVGSRVGFAKARRNVSCRA